MYKNHMYSINQNIFNNYSILEYDFFWLFNLYKELLKFKN